MFDREKVVKALEDFNKNRICLPHLIPWDEIADALALLKEQEAKKVIESTNVYTGLPIMHCPKCGVSIDRYLHGRQHEGQINHCPFCGQAVKWE